MDIEIQIDEPFTSQVKPELLKTTLERVLHIMETPAPMTVVITDSQTIRELNAHIVVLIAPPMSYHLVMSLTLNFLYSRRCTIRGCK